MIRKGGVQLGCISSLLLLERRCFQAFFMLVFCFKSMLKEFKQI